MSEQKREVKRKTTFQGLPINVEIEAGDIKSGIDDQGQRWSHVYQFPYGEIAGTQGFDGDPVDVYVGNDDQAPLVFVVHQMHRNGELDEDKVFLGFPTMQAVTKAYYDHGPEWGFQSAVAMSLYNFVNVYLPRARPMTPGFQSAASAEAAGAKRYGSQ